MIYKIEENFGTSLLLYISGMKSAKKWLTPLFHVNQNPTYSQLDIHSDYIMNRWNPKLLI